MDYTSWSSTTHTEPKPSFVDPCEDPEETVLQASPQDDVGGSGAGLPSSYRSQKPLHPLPKEQSRSPKTIHMQTRACAHRHACAHMHTHRHMYIHTHTTLQLRRVGHFQGEKGAATSPVTRSSPMTSSGTATSLVHFDPTQEQGHPAI